MFKVFDIGSSLQNQISYKRNA